MGSRKRNDGETVSFIGVLKIILTTDEHGYNILAPNDAFIKESMFICVYRVYLR